MARRRGQRLGYLREKSGSWILGWREDALDENGKPIRQQRSGVIAASRGPDAISKREARRIANEHLARLDSRNLRPSSTMTVDAFVERKFIPQHVEMKKPGGRKHYTHLLDKHIIPALGQRRLCDVTTDDVAMIVAAKRREGLSGQSVLHIKNAISAIFRHAKRLRLYGDENPAVGVQVGEIRHEKRPTYNWEQAAVAIQRIPRPYCHMALLSVVTSMNVAEVAGLRRKWANLTGEIRQVDGEILAPYTIGVRENFYEGERGSVKTGKRMRNLGIPEELAVELRKLIARSPFKGADFPVFCSRAGTPIDAHNVTSRVFKPLSKKLGFAVNWHAFRRAHSSFMGELRVPVEDRVATMGHADSRMTLLYSIEDVDRRRHSAEQIMRRLKRKRPGKVVAMRKVASA